MMPSVQGLSASSLKDLMCELGDSKNSNVLSKIDPDTLRTISKRFLRLAKGGTDEEVTGEESSCVRLFVAGSKTHVGKTTICLGILGTLLKMGYRSSELAYIKPATQCEAPDLLNIWCKKMGVEFVGSTNAPLVFKKGFTRSFLDGKENTSKHWLRSIRGTVDRLCKRRKFVLIDGVGFTAVGSIVGVSNADVAKASRAPVCIVCPSGVGGAVDSFNLNATFFEHHGVPVLGGIFNFGRVDGYYSHERCGEYIRKWFSIQRNKGCCFGVVPTFASLDGLREKVKDTDKETLNTRASENISHVERYVKIRELLDCAADACDSVS